MLSYRFYNVCQKEPCIESTCGECICATECGCHHSSSRWHSATNTVSDTFEAITKTCYCLYVFAVKFLWDNGNGLTLVVYKIKTISLKKNKLYLLEIYQLFLIDTLSRT